MVSAGVDRMQPDLALGRTIFRIVAGLVANGSHRFYLDGVLEPPKCGLGTGVKVSAGRPSVCTHDRMLTPVFRPVLARVVGAVVVSQLMHRIKTYWAIDVGVLSP